jgi:hypothetical protein
MKSELSMLQTIFWVRNPKIIMALFDLPISSDLQPAENLCNREVRKEREENQKRVALC